MFSLEDTARALTAALLAPFSVNDVKALIASNALIARKLPTLPPDFAALAQSLSSALGVPPAAQPAPDQTMVWCASLERYIAEQLRQRQPTEDEDV